MSQLTLQQRLAFARQTADEESRSASMRACARKRVKELEAPLTPVAHQRAHVARYRVGGIWKLTERIADRDADGDVINGASDRVTPGINGRNLRPDSDYIAPCLLPAQELQEKSGWAGVRRNAERSYRAHGITHA